MEKKNRLGFLIFVTLSCALFFYSGIASGIDEAPSDFTLSYGWGATHAEWGRYLLEIHPQGGVDLYIGSRRYHDKNGPGPENWAAHKQFIFAKSELSEIFKEIKKNRFYSLKDSYRNEKIMDGSSLYLSVLADGKAKSVTVMNTTVKGVGEIIEKIFKVLDAKDPNWRNALNEY